MQWVFVRNGACGAFPGDTGRGNMSCGSWRGPGNLLRDCAPGVICVLHAGWVLGGGVTFAGATIISCASWLESLSCLEFVGRDTYIFKTTINNITRFRVLWPFLVFVGALFCAGRSAQATGDHTSKQLQDAGRRTGSYPGILCLTLNEYHTEL